MYVIVLIPLQTVQVRVHGWKFRNVPLDFTLYYYQISAWPTFKSWTRWKTQSGISIWPITICLTNWPRTSPSISDSLSSSTFQITPYVRWRRGFFGTCKRWRRSSFRITAWQSCTVKLLMVWQISTACMYLNAFESCETQMYTCRCSYSHLEGNHIQRLEERAFYGLSSLPTLNLRHQGLTYIAKGAFRGLRELTSLDLSYNSLEYLCDGTFHDLSKLTYL